MLLLFDKVSLPFPDIGMIQLESLAMGTPDVSTTMIHFLGSQEDRKQVSRIVRHPNEALVSVDFILSNPEKYKNTRQISQKYYSWENICQKNFEIYNKLVSKYYL